MNNLCLKLGRRRHTHSPPPTAGGGGCGMAVTEDTPPDMLAGSMNLQLVLPDGGRAVVPVQRRTAMMDLLVTVTTRHKLSVAGHALQPYGHHGVLPYKPNTPIGALDVVAVHIVSKSQLSGQHSNKVTLKQLSQPFDITQRIQVRLPRNQLYVLRAKARTTISDILNEVCSEKNLDPSKYSLRHPKKMGEALAGAMTVAEYQHNELVLVSHREATALSTEDIISALGRHHYQVECNSRSLSPDSSVSPPAPVPPRKKKPPAPKPPVNNNKSAASNSSSNHTSSRTHKKGPDGEPSGSGMFQHSRTSSDSSGYHEPSLISGMDSSPPNSNNSLPDSLPRRSKLTEPSNLSRSLSNLSPTATTSSVRPAVSTSALNHAGRKKRPAPAPPAPMVTVQEEKERRRSEEDTKPGKYAFRIVQDISPLRQELDHAGRVSSLVERFSGSTLYHPPSAYKQPLNLKSPQHVKPLQLRQSRSLDSADITDFAEAYPHPIDVYEDSLSPGLHSSSSKLSMYDFHDSSMPSVNDGFNGNTYYDMSGSMSRSPIQSKTFARLSRNSNVGSPDYPGSPDVLCPLSPHKSPTKTSNVSSPSHSLSSEATLSNRTVIDKSTIAKSSLFPKASSSFDNTDRCPSPTPYSTVGSRKSSLFPKASSSFENTERCPSPTPYSSVGGPKASLFPKASSSFDNTDRSPSPDSSAGSPIHKTQCFSESEALGKSTSPTRLLKNMSSNLSSPIHSLSSETALSNRDVPEKSPMSPLFAKPSESFDHTERCPSPRFNSKGFSPIRKPRSFSENEIPDDSKNSSPIHELYSNVRQSFDSSKYDSNNSSPLHKPSYSFSRSDPLDNSSSKFDSKDNSSTRKAASGFTKDCQSVDSSPLHRPDYSFSRNNPLYCSSTKNDSNGNSPVHNPEATYSYDGQSNDYDGKESPIHIPRYSNTYGSDECVLDNLPTSHDHSVYDNNNEEYQDDFYDDENENYYFHSGPNDNNFDYAQVPPVPKQRSIDSNVTLRAEECVDLVEAQKSGKPLVKKESILKKKSLESSLDTDFDLDETDIDDRSIPSIKSPDLIETLDVTEVTPTKSKKKFGFIPKFSTKNFKSLRKKKEYMSLAISNQTPRPFVKRKEGKSTNESTSSSDVDDKKELHELNVEENKDFDSASLYVHVDNVEPLQGTNINVTTAEVHSPENHAVSASDKVSQIFDEVLSVYDDTEMVEAEIAAIKGSNVKRESVGNLPGSSRDHGSYSKPGNSGITSKLGPSKRLLNSEFPETSNVDIKSKIASFERNSFDDDKTAQTPIPRVGRLGRSGGSKSSEDGLPGTSEVGHHSGSRYIAEEILKRRSAFRETSLEDNSDETEKFYTKPAAPDSSYVGSITAKKKETVVGGNKLFNRPMSRETSLEERKGSSVKKQESTVGGTDKRPTSRESSLEYGKGKSVQKSAVGGDKSLTRPSAQDFSHADSNDNSAVAVPNAKSKAGPSGVTSTAGPSKVSFSEPTNVDNAVCKLELIEDDIISIESYHITKNETVLAKRSLKPMNLANTRMNESIDQRKKKQIINDRLYPFKQDKVYQVYFGQDQPPPSIMRSDNCRCSVPDIQLLTKKEFKAWRRTKIRAKKCKCVTFSNLPISDKYLKDINKYDFRTAFVKELLRRDGQFV